MKSLSRVWLFATPWTAAHQARLSMEFSMQEYLDKFIKWTTIISSHRNLQIRPIIKKIF